jgi:hypothetical protein
MRLPVQLLPGMLTSAMNSDCPAWAVQPLTIAPDGVAAKPTKLPAMVAPMTVAVIVLLSRRLTDLAFVRILVLIWVPLGSLPTSWG